MPLGFVRIWDGSSMAVVQVTTMLSVTGTAGYVVELDRHVGVEIGVRIVIDGRIAWALDRR